MSAIVMEKKGKKAPQSHYSVKMESFSLFSKSSFEKFESEEFEAGDYKWSLSIYPNGNKKANGNDHVSIYLVLRNPNSLPVGMEVNAIVNFSIYNFHENEYVSTQDSSVRRFNILKSDWGVSKFIDHATLNDPSKGYLIDDTCVFGVAVFVFDTSFRGECLSMIEKPVNYSHSWKFDNVSKTDLKYYISEPFFAGKYKWTIWFHPNGIVDCNGTSISLYLYLDFSAQSTSSKPKVFVEFTLRAKDQNSDQHYEKKSFHAFSKSSDNWGFRQFCTLAEFKDPKKGLLVKDCCILEADVKVYGL
ncbi:unnamed protein product [Lupinus luteus]|uniref:MATH domain-containing protein n=1 Tax=Lupinus luteus TaxID=3873 RepID=A0AAV1VZ87_LUPLU